MRGLIPRTRAEVDPARMRAGNESSGFNVQACCQEAQEMNVVRRMPSDSSASFSVDRGVYRRGVST